MAETIYIPREVIIVPLVAVGIFIVGYLALLGMMIKSWEK
jgi:hypothetical protein